MVWLWHNIIKFCKVFLSYVVAVARLCIWTCVFFFSGLQRTLFMRSEVAGVDFKIMPLRCDMEEVGDKLAYLDKLCIENPDLVEVMGEEEMPYDDIPFDDEDGDEGSSGDNEDF